MSEAEYIPRIEVYFDGSAGPRQPGGTAAYGYIVYDAERNVIHSGYGRVGTGPSMSCNVAEFSGLIAAMLFIAERFPDTPTTFRGDSTLVINQMVGAANARKGLYLPYYQQAVTIAEPFIARRLWTFEWIPRDMNSEADELSQYSRYKPNAS